MLLLFSPYYYLWLLFFWFVFWILLEESVLLVLDCFLLMSYCGVQTSFWTSIPKTGVRPLSKSTFHHWRQRRLTQTHYKNLANTSFQIFFLAVLSSAVEHSSLYFWPIYYSQHCFFFFGSTAIVKYFSYGSCINADNIECKRGDLDY